MANFVLVTGQFTDENGNPAQGFVTFAPTDVAITVASGQIPSSLVVSSPITMTLDVQGRVQAQLLDMGSPGTATWSWHFSGTVNGVPLPPKLLAVRFTAGAAQDLATILSTATVAPS